MRSRGTQKSGAVLAKLMVFAVSLCVLGCGVPQKDGSSQEGAAAVLDDVYKALSNQECDKAIGYIEGLYNSTYSDNEVRMARASAHLCKAGAPSFFKLAGEIPGEQWSSSPGEGAYLFRSVAKLFYETDTTTLDERSTSGLAAMEALLAAVKSGVYVPASYQVTYNADNVGSVIAADRTDDANGYMIIAAMATMGALENRYSNPYTSNFKKGQALGYQSGGSVTWESATHIEGDGATYFAALLNMVDSFVAVKPKLSAAMQNSLTYLSSLQPLLDAACDLGCKGFAAGGYNTGCAIAGGCPTCPMAVRNPYSCDNKTTTASCCAAAGLANFIDTDTGAGWVTGP